VKANRTEQDIYRAECAADRRVVLRAHGRCICGPLEGFVSKNGIKHGPVVSGGRCQRCIDVKKGLKN
jgi:hypothetical protein